MTPHPQAKILRAIADGKQVQLPRKSLAPITVALITSLRIKATLMDLGEKIAWGSDTTLMRQAADMLEARTLTPPDGWDGVVERANFFVEPEVAGFGGSAEFFAQAILDMNAKIKELK
jgi:hypothetical protein